MVGELVREESLVDHGGLCGPLEELLHLMKWEAIKVFSRGAK